MNRWREPPVPRIYEGSSQAIEVFTVELDNKKRQVTTPPPQTIITNISLLVGIFHLYSFKPVRESSEPAWPSSGRLLKDLSNFNLTFQTPCPSSLLELVSSSHRVLLKQRKIRTQIYRLKTRNRLWSMRARRLVLLLINLIPTPLQKTKLPKLNLYVSRLLCEILNACWQEVVLAFASRFSWRQTPQSYSNCYRYRALMPSLATYIKATAYDQIHRTMVPLINTISPHPVLLVLCRRQMVTRHKPMASYPQMKKLNGWRRLAGPLSLAREVSRRQKLRKVYLTIRHFWRANWTTISLVVS